jgi:SMP-30/gluconolaconase/LRE-like protein
MAGYYDSLRMAQTHAGSLYRLDINGTRTTALTDLTLANGIGWSPDARTMYHVDSAAATLFAYDYDLDHGTLRRRATTSPKTCSPEAGRIFTTTVDVPGQPANHATASDPKSPDNPGSRRFAKRVSAGSRYSSLGEVAVHR